MTFFFCKDDFKNTVTEKIGILVNLSIFYKVFGIHFHRFKQCFVLCTIHIKLLSDYAEISCAEVIVMVCKSP